MSALHLDAIATASSFTCTDPVHHVLNCTTMPAATVRQTLGHPNWATVVLTARCEMRVLMHPSRLSCADTFLQEVAGSKRKSH